MMVRIEMETNMKKWSLICNIIKLLSKLAFYLFWIVQLIGFYHRKKLGFDMKLKE